jgi:predicted MarR family transcription regulator
MTTAQEILSQQDVFLAIKQKKVAKQTEILEVQQKLATAINGAFAPVPKATNRVELAMQIARNAFNIWQGVNMGIKIVRGFRSAFKK